MPFKKLLIANRGEIAIRIARAAGEAGLATVAIHPADDALSLHVRTADEAHEIPGRGARAYLDIEAVVAAAKASCDAVHPGYGFLSENAASRGACAERASLSSVRRPEALELFGDKSQAQGAGRSDTACRSSPAPTAPTTLEEMHAFFASLSGAPMVIKALAGGGGRGIRVVRKAEEISDAYARCCSEALSAFGNGSVYAERLIAHARHIEIQILGDGTGAVAICGSANARCSAATRSWSRSRRRPALTTGCAADIIDAPGKLARAVNYDNSAPSNSWSMNDRAIRHAFAFIEANPRLQVEHTVTEAVTGVDIVQTQLQLAMGRSLKDAGPGGKSHPAARGFAIQLRVNLETMDADGTTIPSGGTLAAFDPPSGPGLRIDTFGYAGYRTSAALRLAAGQGDRPQPGGRLCHGHPGGTSRAVRIPHRRRDHQYRLPAGAAAARRRAGLKDHHALAG